MCPASSRTTAPETDVMVKVRGVARGNTCRAILSRLVVSPAATRLRLRGGSSSRERTARRRHQHGL